MVTIDAQSTFDSIKNRIGFGSAEHLRSSPRREEYLRKYAQLMAEDPDLKLQLNPNQAKVSYADDEVTIFIPTRETAQPVTNFPEHIWDMLVQETITIHELGHVLYTDWPAFEERWRTVATEHERGPYIRFFNAVEDGAIETQMKRDYSAKTAAALETMNENLVRNAQFGSQGPFSRHYTYSVYQAVGLALAHYAIHPCPQFDRLFDPADTSHVFHSVADEQLVRAALPEMRRHIRAFMLPSGEDRAIYYHDHLWPFCKALIDQGTGSGGDENGEGGDGGWGDYDEPGSVPRGEPGSDGEAGTPGKSRNDPQSDADKPRRRARKLGEGEGDNRGPVCDTCDVEYVRRRA